MLSEKTHDMEQYDVIIIGSGLGGLQCAYIMSREGFNVCVLEKNHQVGGCLQNFSRDGCIFDTGIHYIGGLDEGQVLNRFFKYFGLIDKLKLRKMNPDAFDVISFYDDEREFPLASGHENFTEQLSRFFPGKRKMLDDYCSKLKSICDFFPLYNLSDQQMDIAESSFYEESAYNYMLQSIDDERLRNVLVGTNPLYAGLASKTPMYVHALVNNSFIESSWRIEDGSGQIAEILCNGIRSFGGTILTKSEASRFIFTDNKLAGLELTNGRKLFAKSFISDIHPVKTLEMIDEGYIRKAYRERIYSLENTTSNFTFYGVFKENSFPYLPHNHYHYHVNNVWSCPVYLEENWPESYLLITPATSKSSQWADGAIIMTYMKFDEVKKWTDTTVGKRGEDYLEFKQKKTERLLDAVEKKFPGFRSHLKSYTTSSPLTYRDYTGTVNGSLYGIMKDCNDPLKTLISPRTKIPNLFLTGQNIILHGVLGVTIGAVTTCSEILGLSYLVDKIKKG